MNGGSQDISSRRAIEALRNGVPNSDAVRVLGSNQESVEQLFLERLAAVEDAALVDRQIEGLLVKGRFGTGKSHLLKYLQVKAISENFVCSHIVISKETPMFNPMKVYRAAIEAARGPRLSGQAIKEIALGLRQDTPAYAELYTWANGANSGVHQLFPATLLLHERLSNDPELVEKITNFWSGDSLKVADVKHGLRQIRQAATFDLKGKVPASLPRERFRFAARLILGAGYRGWVLLLDEVELVGRFNAVERGKSYAELARWLGRSESTKYPGILAVAAITDDFDLAVLQGKGDRDSIGPRLRTKGTEEFNMLASEAEAGMRIIEREALTLAPPDDSVLDQTYRKLKDLHARAYDWEPPDIEWGRKDSGRAMRSWVRRWINEWDLRRLYPGASVSTEEQELRPSYEEDRDLRESSDGDQTIGDSPEQVGEQDGGSIPG